jgi:hypothetical protein
MLMSARTVLLVALAAAAVVFCIVQDRVTAAGVRQYVELQRAAIEGPGEPVILDDVMRPAVRRSVVLGSIWGAVVFLAGAAVAFVIRDSRSDSRMTNQE